MEQLEALVPIPGLFLAEMQTKDGLFWTFGEQRHFHYYKFLVPVVRDIWYHPFNTGTKRHKQVNDLYSLQASQ